MNAKKRRMVARILKKQRAGEPISRHERRQIRKLYGAEKGVEWRVRGYQKINWKRPQRRAQAMKSGLFDPRSER